MQTWFGAGVAHGRHPGHDRILVAPGHDGVDEPVAAAVGEVLVLETEVAQVVGVVRQVHVDRGVPASGLAGRRGSAIEHDCQLDGDQRVGAEDGAGGHHVLRRHEVRVRPGRSIAGQTEHPGPQRREHAGLDRERRGGPVEAIEVLDHLGVRLRVATGLAMIDQRRVAHAQPEQEPALPVVAPPGRRPATSAASWSQTFRMPVATPMSVGGTQQHLDRGQHIAPHVGDPQGAVAELVELGGQLRDQPADRRSATAPPRCPCPPASRRDRRRRARVGCVAGRADPTLILVRVLAMAASIGALPAPAHRGLSRRRSVRSATEDRPGARTRAKPAVWR